MQSLISRCVLLAVVAIAPSLRAEQVLDHLPPDALGFAIARNLKSTNAKAVKVMEIFQDLAPRTITAPLPMILGATNLGACMDTKGDALLAVLPGEEDSNEPRLMLLIPIMNYAHFAASFEGCDASGEISRITFVGEEVLAAKLGSFALLMNVENREQMEAILAPEPEASAPGAAAEPAPLAEWVAQNDLAAVITPAGMKVLTALGKANLAEQQAQVEEQYNAPATANVLRQFQQSFALTDAVLGLLDAEIDAVGLGLAIDDEANIRFTQRMRLLQSGELTKIAAATKPSASPFAPYADGVFVAAAGGPLPPEWLGASSAFSRKLMEKNAKLYGFQEFNAEDWAKVEASWKKAMTGLHCFSAAILPGDGDDPLYSNMYGVMKVDDSKEYLKSSRESIELWNGLVERSKGDIKLTHAIADAKIGDRAALLMTVDVARAVADPNVPQMQGIMEQMFGADGKLRMYLVAADEQTVVMGVGAEDRIAAAVEQAIRGDAGLADSPNVQATVKLLDPAAPWQGLVSPQGCVAWFQRMMTRMMANMGAVGPTFPRYPAAPPVGFSLNLAKGELGGEMVWPVETLESLADYMKTCGVKFP